MRMPLADIGIIASGKIPILVPEIVLLYKAHERTEKDEADFRAAASGPIAPFQELPRAASCMRLTSQHPTIRG